MNLQILSGRVGQVAQLKTFGQNKVCEFSLATSENIKVNDKWVQDTEWHNCKAWGKIADIAAKLEKGEYLLIHGKKKTEQYTNKQGVKVAKVVTIVDKIERIKFNTEKNSSRQQYTNDTQNLSPEDLEPQDGDMPF